MVYINSTKLMKSGSYWSIVQRQEHERWILLKQLLKKWGSIRLAEGCLQCQTMQNRAIHVGCYKTQTNFPPAERLLVSNGRFSMRIVSTELYARPGTPGRTAASETVQYDDLSPSSVLHTTAGSACSSFDFNFDPALRNNFQIP
jgi:hypothetical protein